MSLQQLFSWEMLQSITFYYMEAIMRLRKICVASMIILAVAIAVVLICYFSMDTKEVFEGTFI